jgi:hypothetical protein
MSEKAGIIADISNRPFMVSSAVYKLSFPPRPEKSSLKEISDAFQ